MWMWRGVGEVQQALALMQVVGRMQAGGGGKRSAAPNRHCWSGPRGGVLLFNHCRRCIMQVH